MKFCVKFGIVLILFFSIQVKGDEAKLYPDSTQENAEELVRIINAGLNSDEITTFIYKTKINDFLLARLDAYSDKLLTDKGKYFLRFAMASVFLKREIPMKHSLCVLKRW